MAQKKKPKIQNIVAKFATQFNKSAVFADKTKYSRTEKHKTSQEVFVIFPNIRVLQKSPAGYISQIAV